MPDSPQKHFHQANLRPDALNDFHGQTDVKRRVMVSLVAAKKRGECLPHMLIAGPPGLGKTTLAQILAKEMGAKIHITSGPSLEKPADLAGTLVGLEAGDILFIDEIHRMPTQIEEFLYPAMEDRQLDILIDQGPSAKTVRLDLAAFTLIAATTKPGGLTAPLRSRFQTIHRLELYSPSELSDIIVASARRLDCDIDPKAADEIAGRSRGTPRIANNHLLWVRDFATASDRPIDLTTTKEALEDIGIGENGLDATDRKILSSLCENFHGGPSGIAAIAVACGEDARTIEDVHEPYLVANDYLRRTAQGRIATQKGYEAIGLKAPDSRKDSQPTLFSSSNEPK